MAAEVLPIALDNASNIKIFEKLAPPHLINAQRLEDVKEMNHVSDLPVGRRHAQMSIVSGGSPPPLPKISSSGDSIDAILADGMSAHARKTSPPPSLSRPSPSIASSAHSPPPLSQVSAPSPPPITTQRYSAQRGGGDHGVAGPSLPTQSFEQDVRAAMQPTPAFPSAPLPAAPSPFPTAPSPFPTAPASPFPMHDQKPAQGLPPLIPPVQGFSDEFERLRANVRPQAHTVQDMHHRYEQRKAAAPVPQNITTNYAELYHEACRTRQAHMGGGGGYRPSADPNYAEKKELLIKLDELRMMGFSVPTYDMSMPIEDLQSEVHRRTMSQGTISTLNSAIGWINGFAGFVQMVNDAAGPFIPMPTYAKDVKEGTSTPRFKYALYQIILRWRGRSGMNPWTEIITILLIPLIEGIAIKIAQWFLKGRKGILNSNTAKSGIKSLFRFMRPNPTDGVPSGIPGVSADTPVRPTPSSFPMPSSIPTQKPAPPQHKGEGGAFGGNYPKARDYAAEQAQAPKPPSGDLKKKKRLMTPQEVHEMNARKHPPQGDEMSGLVITEEQRETGSAI